MEYARSARPSERWALLPLRLVVGYGFLAHGLVKWERGPTGFAKLLAQIDVPFPTVTAYGVTLLEMAGGTAILAGVLIPLVSLPLAFTMLMAMLRVHLPFGFSSVNTVGLSAAGPVFGPPGYEINLLYIASLGVLSWLGPGPLAAGGWRRARHAARLGRGRAETRHDRLWNREFDVL